MSELVVTALTIVDGIPIGRRIAEIMKEKGSAFSKTSVALKLNINRETFRLMLNGKREVYQFELRNISLCLNVSVDRILQSDIQNIANEFMTLIDTKSDINRAFDLAVKMNAVAIGLSERTMALMNIGRALYALGNYDKAHERFVEAYQLAELLVKKYDDYERLYLILSKLMVTFTIRKDYVKLSEILDKVEGYFMNSPEKQGAIYFSKAMIAENMNNTEQERENWHKSLECFRLAGLEIDVGRIYLNIGYFEYKQQNYEKAKLAIEKSIERLENDAQYKPIAVKEYAKILIKLGEKEKATELLLGNINLAERYPTLLGKYYLLLAISENNISYLEKIESASEAEIYFF